MKKKIIFSLLSMLCLFSQQALALRFRVRVPSGSSEGSNGAVTWIVYAVLAVIVVVSLYRYFFKIRGFLRQFSSGLRMDENTSLTKDQQRKMLLSAIYAESEKAYLNTIKTGTEKEDREELLKRDWDIRNHDTAIDALNELKAESLKGYMQNIGEAFKLKEQKAIEQYIKDTFVNPKDAQQCARQIENAFKTIGNLVKEGIVKEEAEFVRVGKASWDANRLIYIARQCFDSKYISEQELWEYVDVADEQAHKSISSWEDYAKSYFVGYCLFGAKSYDIKHNLPLVKKLVEDPKSPWKTFPFAK